MGIVQAIIALLKAIPALTNFARWLDGTINERKASERLEEKNAAADDSIDRIAGLRNSQTPGQLKEADGKK